MGLINLRKPKTQSLESDLEDDINEFNQLFDNIDFNEIDSRNIEDEKFYGDDMENNVPVHTTIQPKQGDESSNKPEDTITEPLSIDFSPEPIRKTVKEPEIHKKRPAISGTAQTQTTIRSPIHESMSNPDTLKSEYAPERFQEIKGEEDTPFTEYAKVFEQDTNLATVWYNKGVILSRIGKHEKAISAFEQSLLLSPGYVRAWNNKGVALSRAGRYEEALEAYEQALLLDAGHISAWNNKGVALSKLGRYTEAIDAYEQALQISPTYPEGHHNEKTVRSRRAIKA